jgi:hypothetical protein
MNKHIIDQHEEIFMIFDLLLDEIEKHTKYEQIILDERNESKPDNHINVDKKIEQHKLYHKKLIKQIETIYKDFETHIITMDIKHMHKL